MSAKLLRPALALISIALSLAPFFLLVQLGVDVVRIYGGLAAFAGLVSLIPVGIGEMAFVITIGALLERGQRRGRLGATFLRVAAAELFSLPVLELARFALYSPLTRWDLSLHRALLRPAYGLFAAAGLVLGSTALAAAAVVDGRRRA